MVAPKVLSDLVCNSPPLKSNYESSRTHVCPVPHAANIHHEVEPFLIIFRGTNLITNNLSKDQALEFLIRI